MGGGDSFAGALLYALDDPELAKDPAACVSFATAASCLCHTIRGDFNFVSRAEVVALMGGEHQRPRPALSALAPTAAPRPPGRST